MDSITRWPCLQFAPMAPSPNDTRPDAASRGVHRDLQLLAAVGAAVAVAGVVGAVLNGNGHGWWALAVLSAGLSAATGWVGTRVQARVDAVTRTQRFRAQRLDALLDEAWVWRTDRQGRINQVRPPLHAASPDWSSIPSQSTAIDVAWEATTADDTRSLRSRLRAGSAVPPTVVRLSGPDARAATWVLRAQPCIDGAGRFCGYEGSLVALPEAPARAPAAEPEAAPQLPTGPSEQDIFVYSVSHDLRAPLRVIQGFTRILREDYGTALDRIAVDHLDRIENAAVRMGTMIESLLALSRLSNQPMQRQPVNLSQLARFVLDDLQQQQPQRHVDVRIEPDLVVQGDPTLLRTVLENLLGNAWKYSASRDLARIEFGARRDAGAPPEFFVRDNGAGFDMRYADKLFGPFQRLHSASQFEGTGVGLASVRRILERHGGRIRGEGEVDRGACFYFTVP